MEHSRRRLQHRCRPGQPAADEIAAAVGRAAAAVVAGFVGV